MDEQQRAEAERLVKWIRQNGDDWNMISHYGNLENADAEEVIRLLNRMVNEGFYQIALILLSTCQILPKSDKAVIVTFLDTLLYQENGKGIEQFLRRTVQNFKLLELTELTK